MPDLAYVVVPSVYNSLTEEEAREMTKPVVGEIMTLLTDSTTPALDQDEAEVDRVWRSERLIDYSGDFDAAMRSFNQTFLDRDWGDGYPLWPPTPEGVEELMAGVDGAPDDYVCTLPPGEGRATVELVATNAAMAGCRPEEMPVIMAALRAIANHDRVMRLVVTTSTSTHAPMVFVNGPVAQQLGINGGQSCIGPGRQNRVNLRIGRAVLLCMKNIARWYPGVLDMDTMGTLRKNVVVIAENEAESPWEPYHVSEGFEAGESTVTVVWTVGEWDITMQGHKDAEQLADAIGSMVANYHGYMDKMKHLDEGVPYPVGRLLLLAPPHAQPLAEGGFTKRDLEQRLFDVGHVPVKKLRDPCWKMYEDGKIREQYNWVFEMSEEEAIQQTLPVIEAPEMYKVVVAGSVRAKNLFFPTRGFPVTEKVTPTPSGK